MYREACRVVTAFNLDEEDQQTFKLKLQTEQLKGKKLMNALIASIMRITVERRAIINGRKIEETKASTQQ